MEKKHRGNFFDYDFISGMVFRLFNVANNS